MRTSPMADSKPRITYPHVVTKGSTSVKIYRVKNVDRGEAFEVTWYRAGKRHRKVFRKEKDALKRADEAAKALDVGHGLSLTLAGSELEFYRHARQSLARLANPPAIHVAVDEFVSAKSLLGDVPLLVAVERFMAETKAKSLKPIAIPELVKEFIAAKRADRLSDRYIKDCEIRLGHFARDFKTEVTSVKTPDIDAWLRALMLSPRSRNNYRVLIVTLFGYARTAGYLPKDRITEAKDVARAKDKGGDIEIFTPDELKRLLDAAGDAVLPYLAFGAFAGIRTAEVLRLTWDCIRFDRKVIEIKAGMAKTAQRRLIPLTDNLALWLRPLAKSHGPVITLARPEKTAGEVVCAMCDPVIPWKRNGLRHSYASYRLAILKDAGKLALEMGNSPGLIFSNYRELVSEEDANAWFALFPKPKIDPIANDATVPIP